MDSFAELHLYCSKLVAKQAEYTNLLGHVANRIVGVLAPHTCKSLGQRWKVRVQIAWGTYGRVKDYRVTVPMLRILLLYQCHYFELKPSREVM